MSGGGFLGTDLEEVGGVSNKKLSMSSRISSVKGGESPLSSRLLLQWIVELRCYKQDGDKMESQSSEESNVIHLEGSEAGFYIVPDKRRMYGTNFSRYEVKRVKNETLEQEEPQNIHAIPGVRVTHDRISCRPVSYDTLCTRIVLLHQHLGGG